jgi:hypothetical protein
VPELEGLAARGFVVLPFPAQPANTMSITHAVIRVRRLFVMPRSWVERPEATLNGARATPPSSAHAQQPRGTVWACGSSSSKTTSGLPER